MVTFTSLEPIWRIVVTEKSDDIRLEVYDSFNTLLAFEQRPNPERGKHE